MFRFFDLFAGIGGMRLAAEAAGVRSFLSSETSGAARRTYTVNFGEVPVAPKKLIEGSEADQRGQYLVSLAQHNGGRAFIEDGFAWVKVKQVIETGSAAAVFNLEVADDNSYVAEGVVIHNCQAFSRGGKGLGYSVAWRLMNANRFGLAQWRERILIVARRGPAFQFPDVDARPIDTRLRDVLDREGEFEFLDPGAYTLLDPGLVKESPTGLVFSGYRNKNIRRVGVKPGTEHLSRVHKQPNRIYRSDGTHPTLSSQESCGRYFVEHGGRVRKITLAEAFRLQGFPEGFVRLGSVGEQHRQIVGNSVPLPMIAEIACRAVGAPIRRPALRAAA